MEPRDLKPSSDKRNDAADVSATAEHSGVLSRYPEAGCLIFVAIFIGIAALAKEERSNLSLLSVGCAAVVGILAVFCLVGRLFLKFPRLMLFLAVAAAYHTFGVSIFVYLAIALWALSLR